MHSQRRISAIRRSDETFHVAVESITFREGDLGAAPGETAFTGSELAPPAGSLRPVRPSYAGRREEIDPEIDGAVRPVRYKVQLSQSAVIG
jgi:multidrug efflux pump subunit AcrA (membrane-fusion protein)